MGLFRSAFSRVPKHQKFAYHPRYYKEDELDKKGKSRIKFRKGELFHSSKHGVAGKFRKTPLYFRQAQSRSSKYYKLVVLSLMSAVIYGYFIHELNVIIALVSFFILLVLFIRQNNRY